MQTHENVTFCALICLTCLSNLSSMRQVEIEGGILSLHGALSLVETFWIHLCSVQFSSVQSLSHVQLFATPWTAAHEASLSITNSLSPPKPMSIVLAMPIQPFHPLSFPSPPALNLSQHQGLFKRVSSPHWAATYWSFRFNVSPSNEHPGLTSFRMDWLDLLAVQGTLRSLLQHHSSKASILLCSAFFFIV